MRTGRPRNDAAVLPPVDRVLRKTVWQEGCWTFIGCRTKKGYGQVSLTREHRGPKAVVHRVVWEALVGPLPREMQLDHLCRNASCVNPLHLEPVTQEENLRRGAKPGRKRKK